VTSTRRGHATAVLGPRVGVEVARPHRPLSTEVVPGLKCPMSYFG
jgi:hypothetical protein